MKKPTPSEFDISIFFKSIESFETLSILIPDDPQFSISSPLALNPDLMCNPV